MNAEELLSLIESDLEASVMFAHGNDSGCRDRLLQIAPRIRVPVPASDIQYEAVLSGAWSAITIARESADTPTQIKGACIAFLDWIKSGRPIDFDLPQVQGMLAGLIAAGLVSQATADLMSNLQNAAPTITIDEVSALRQQQ
jgi:hypothetical protein